MTVLKIGWSYCCGEVEIEVVLVKIGWSGCCGEIEWIGWSGYCMEVEWSGCLCSSAGVADVKRLSGLAAMVIVWRLIGMVVFVDELELLL